MKKSILKAFTIMVTTATSLACAAQTPANDNVANYTFDNFKLHIYTSAEAMGDNSLLIECVDSVIVIEPQSFYKSIEDFNSYIASIGKPINKVVANYHSGGLASCDHEHIVVVEPMVDFMQSPMAQGMLQHFDNIFGGAMDTRSVEGASTIPAVTSENWDGVEFTFTQGASTDFPASSINIGGDVYYTHFSPNRMHPSPMQITSLAALDATITALNAAKESGCELFIGSHGVVANLSDVEFLIAYLTRVKQLHAANTDAASLATAIKAEYPELLGAENIEQVAANLYK